MVPKSENASSPDKSCPLALTNELYKIISCIFVDRVKPMIGKLIGPWQSAFIPRRSISINIL